MKTHPPTQPIILTKNALLSRSRFEILLLTQCIFKAVLDHLY